MSSFAMQLFHHLDHLFRKLHCYAVIHEGDLHAHDAEEVMEALGLRSAKGLDQRSKHMDEAYALMEEKEASEEELEEAFQVFDGDGDGLISAVDLRSVMRRLRHEEGMRLEDCKRMISAYDQDGDGKINRKEFRNLLEHAV
ncbi:probable calcium-binding protein CML43 [Typha latifolia]|uniref:probable calcium-binding protein CML43 n=1 Tax=Typha latifolia TaxID=4733 RepID=UPI003C2CC678